VEIVRTGAVGDVESEAEVRAQYARWSRLVREGEQVPDLSPAEVEAEVARRRTGCHVGVVEFLDLADGRRIVADCGLGYSTSPMRAYGVASGEQPPVVPHPSAATSLDEMRELVLFVIEADADDLIPWSEANEHLSGREAAEAAGVGADWLRSRWSRLVSAAAAAGVAVSPAQLEAAPFEVELSDRFLAERERHLS
jgi:hypothetical protein